MSRIKVFGFLFVLFVLMGQSFAEHVIRIKIYNLNTENNCNNKWCQVYVEIPAKLYMDKGWLREDLRNLKFVDPDHGLGDYKTHNDAVGSFDTCYPDSSERDALSWWVGPTKNGEFRTNRLPVWLLVYDLDPGETKFINMIIGDPDDEYHANPRALEDFRSDSGWDPDGDCDDPGEDMRKYPARFGEWNWEIIGKTVFHFFAHGLWGDFIGWNNSGEANWSGYGVPQYGIDDSGTGSFGNPGFCNRWAWHAHCTPNLKVLMDMRHHLDKYGESRTGWDNTNGVNGGIAVDVPFTLSFILYYKSTDVIKSWNPSYANWYHHSDTGDIFYVYFLTQLEGNSNYWATGCNEDWHAQDGWRCSPNGESVESFPGYRLRIEKPSLWKNYTDDHHYHRYYLRLHLEFQNSKNGGWQELAELDYPIKEEDVDNIDGWFLYDATKHFFDIKVGPQKIYVYINGEKIGEVSRRENWRKGIFGFDRRYWVTADWNDINEIMVRSFFKEEPSFEVYNYVDAMVDVDGNGSWVGEDLIELVPQVQISQFFIGGNTLDDYIFAKYSMAKANQRAEFKIKIRNRNENKPDVVLIESEVEAEPSVDDWLIYWCDKNGNDCHLNPPASEIVAANSAIERRIKVIPSPSALFSGGYLRIKLKFTSSRDLMEDNIQLEAKINTNLGCWWKYKMPITIHWGGRERYETLFDYQVKIEAMHEKLKEAVENGADIVVTDWSGNKVPFYLKSFDRTNGKLVLWARVPKIEEGSNNNTVYIWWGNPDFKSSLSDPEATFDLWETWDDYPLRERFRDNNVGCNDGSPDCTPEDFSVRDWKNITASGQNYNWWFVSNKMLSVNQDGYSRSQYNFEDPVLLADIYQLTPPTGGSYPYSDQWPCKAPRTVSSKSGWHSCEWGPMLRGGSKAWTHYEVSYRLKILDSQYLGGSYPNPIFNSVFVEDFGNVMGMEIFRELGATKFIFRPVSSGIDWVWQKQAKMDTDLTLNRWFTVKQRAFRLSSGQLRLSMLITDGADVDIDNDADFEKVVDFVTPKIFSAKHGAIGFSGWDGGFVFDDIRVRKYVTDENGKEPRCVPGVPEELNPRGTISLSQPQITPPLFEGRSGYLVSEAVPFSWLGDVKLYYADCYLGGNCEEGENATRLGTISIFGNLTETEPKGLGYHLMEAKPGDNNRNGIYDPNWKSNGRYILTCLYNETNHDFNGFDYFNLSNCTKLKAYLGVEGSCDSSDSYIDPAERLIKFVRGFYESSFPRSEARNMDDRYGDGDGDPEDNEQWKLGDILHSNPLIVAVPSMGYVNGTYQEFRNENNDRPLVIYFMSNEGMLHAFLVAEYNGTRYVPVNSPIELWAYIPGGVLPRLKLTTSADHHYTTDGLLRAIDVYNGTAWSTVLVGALGRGGETIFAIDVTDPKKPKLLWELNKQNSPELFDKIGQTISAPALGKLGDKWVAVFGSGFSENFIENYTEKKAYLAVVNLLNGIVEKIIKVNDKIGNVLTDITVRRRPWDGEIEKVYFGDYYGALWGVTGGRLSALLTESGNVTLRETDMLFKPYYYDGIKSPEDSLRPITARPVWAKGESRDEYWVFFGTGDYDEYDPNYPHQRFYAIRDTGLSGPLVDSEACNGEEGCGDFVVMTSSNATNHGRISWVIELGHTDEADRYGNFTSVKDRNERVLRRAEVFGGYVFFTTFQPENDPCGGGIARFYGVKYNEGTVVRGLYERYPNEKVRSIQLATSGIPSQPMIYLGPGKQAKVVTGVVSSTSGETEKIELRIKVVPVDILLWRRVK